VDAGFASESTTKSENWTAVVDRAPRHEPPRAAIERTSTSGGIGKFSSSPTQPAALQVLIATPN
jgi:hypothetical protein